MTGGGTVGLQSVGEGGQEIVVGVIHRVGEGKVI